MDNALVSRIRIALLAAVIVVSAGLIPTATRAQVCTCDLVTVVVGPDVLCDVTFYPQAPLCRFAPVTVSPGTIGHIACCDDMKISITDCHGNSYTFEAGGPPCFTSIPVSQGCCIDACASVNAKGCVEIRVRRSAGLCPAC